MNGKDITMCNEKGKKEKQAKRYWQKQGSND